MKKLKYLCSAFLVASLLAIPAAAQKRGGGAVAGNNSRHRTTGQARAEEVQNSNEDKPKKTKKTKKTKRDHDPAASMNKNGEGNHKALGHDNP